MNERTRLCGMQDCPREAITLVTYIDICGVHLNLANDAVLDVLAQPGREERRQEREEALGAVYVIRVDSRIKVGFSIDPHRRLQQYPPGSECWHLLAECRLVSSAICTGDWRSTELPVVSGIATVTRSVSWSPT